MDRTRPRGRLGHRPAAVLEAIIPLTTPTVPVVYLAAPPTAITPTAYKSLFFADPLTLDAFVSPISTSHSLIRQSYLPPDMYLPSTLVDVDFGETKTPPSCLTLLVTRIGVLSVAFFVSSSVHCMSDGQEGGAGFSHFLSELSLRIIRNTYFTKDESHSCI